MNKIIASHYNPVWFIRESSLLETAQTLRAKILNPAPIVTELDSFNRRFHQLALMDITLEDQALLVAEKQRLEGKPDLSKKELKPLQALAPTHCYLCEDPDQKAIASHIIARGFLAASGFETGLSMAQSAAATRFQSIKHGRVPIGPSPFFVVHAMARL